ncbi:MAG: hypothetical protein KKB51_20740 [Candidatus Riflebacteria bacterium]|nr:hypothetical protein [Candidatus Riflebacteria bacterium]
MIKKTIKSQASQLQKFAPIILWIMLILLPAMAAKMIFNAALSIEQHLYYSRMQQKLRVELQKYDNALSPLQFLVSEFAVRSGDDILRSWLEGNDIQKSYRTHKIFGQLPNFSESQSEVIEKFNRLALKEIGMLPKAFFVLSEQKNDCFWQLKHPFKQPEKADEFRSSLAKVWQVLRQRNVYGINQVPADLDKYKSVPELNQTVGALEPIKNYYGSFFERFSILENAVNYFITLPVPDFVTGKGDKYILAGFSRSNFSPQFMLKKKTADYSNSVFTHKFGVTGEKNLPAFAEYDEQMMLVGQTPAFFSKVADKIVVANDKQLAISVSCQLVSHEARLKKQIVDAILAIATVVSGILLLAVYLRKIDSITSLYLLVKLGFLTGILLPLSASIWLGICHLNSKKQLETEQMLDFMQHKLGTFEKKIELQKYRSVLFNNLFAEWAGSLPTDELKHINELTGYASHKPDNWESLKVKENLSKRFYSYFLVHPAINEDVIGLVSGQCQNTASLQPIFISPARDILFQLGAYNYLSGENTRQTILKSQITMGLIDVAIDRKMLSKLFAEERTPVTNSMTPGLEFISCCFWKNQQSSKTGAIFMQSDRNAWKSEVLDMIKDQKIRTLFYQSGYELSLRLYFPKATSQRTLEPSTYDLPTRYAPGMTNLWETAQAMFSVSQTSRINNIDSGQPHLLAGQAADNGEIYLMAHAVPIPGKFILSSEMVFLMLSILALVSSYCLASGVAWLLLRSIPAFQDSMQEMAKQNYLWQIELNSGDEFDKLALTFNKLTRQLHEREQISQLVSRNVLDAINSGDDQMLKPGGSRVTASILFADIRSFTTLTEKHPPATIVSMLNDYFSLMAEKIEKHGGIIDKLIGDAIQAVFYHHECENCAESAVKAGLAMREALAGFNQQRQQNGLFAVDNGVGITTGSVICGRVGSEHGKLDATVVGSLVSQAAHLEGLSKFGSSSKVFIDQATAKKLDKTIKLKDRKIDDAISVIEVIS